MKGRIVRPEKDTGSVLPRIGFIKTGFKDPQTGYPKSTDYFVADSIYKRYFEAAYDKPSTVHIAFFDDDPQMSCNEEYILIDNDGKKFGTGDGHCFEIWNGNEYQPLFLEDYPELMEQTAKRAQSKKGWEVVLTMRFILPKIPKVLGYWEYNTRASASTIPNIRKTFDSLLEQRGSVLGMMFDLNVQYAKSFKPGKANRYPVVSLVPNHMDDNLEILKGSIANLAYEHRTDRTIENK
jgi:hypothetical protein